MKEAAKPEQQPRAEAVGGSRDCFLLPLQVASSPGLEVDPDPRPSRRVPPPPRPRDAVRRSEPPARAQSRQEKDGGWVGSVG